MDTELDAAIFDMGGVLTTPILPSFGEFEAVIGAPSGSLVSLFLEQYAGGEDQDFHLLERGEITETEYYRRLEAALRDRTGADVRLPEDPVSVRRGLLGRVGRNEEMIEAAQRISRRYPTALLTNNVREWRQWRDTYLEDLFAVVVDSSEVGLRKPDPAIFLLTCERLGVAPERAAFVDDVSEHVQAARALGMTAIRFTDTEETLALLRPLFPRAFDESPAGAEARPEAGEAARPAAR
ncbi:MAG: HAD family phosphatase [Acidobacteria bacterium]|nr:HAD family phosphatase [Acidobacteriota bacterium]